MSFCNVNQNFFLFFVSCDNILFYLNSIYTIVPPEKKNRSKQERASFSMLIKIINEQKTRI